MPWSEPFQRRTLGKHRTGTGARVYPTPMPDELQRPLSVAAQMQLALAHEVRALVEQGASTLEMFEALARAHPNYSLTLDSIERLARQVSDRRPVAQRYLNSKSFAMAQNVVENGKPADHVRALEGLGGVLDAGERQGGGVTIIVGGDAHIALLHGPRADRD